MLRQLFVFVMMSMFLFAATTSIYAQDTQVDIQIIDTDDKAKKETPSDNDSDGPSVTIVPDDEDKGDGGDTSDDTGADTPKDDVESGTQPPAPVVKESAGEQEENAEAEKEVEKEDKPSGEQEAEEETDPAPVEEEPVVEESLAEEEEAVIEESLPEEEEPELLEEEEEVVEQELEEEVEDVLSIDTLSVEEPSGNWFFKRHWYQKAQSKYGHIGATISAILQSRADLLRLNDSVQNELLDSFYREIGFNLGEANSTISSLLTQLEELRQKKGNLDDEQTKLFTMLESAQDELEQLALDMEDVVAHDNAFENTMRLVVQQIDAAYAYQTEAFDAVQTIARELNDLAAKGEYLKVRSYARSVKDIQVYLEGDLSRYLNTLARQMKTLTEQIVAELLRLKNIGIDIPEEAQRLRGELCMVEEPADEVLEVTKEDSQPGFISRIVQGIVNILVWPLKALGLISGDGDDHIGVESEQISNDDTPLNSNG